MLDRLAQGPATVKELAEPFKISMPAISKHLKVLEHAGLIERGREAQWRPAQLQAAPLKDAAQWLETYRQNWEENFDRLDDIFTQASRGAEKLVSFPSARLYFGHCREKYQEYSKGK